MFRNSFNSRGAAANTGNPVPRLRTVWLALVLMLALGSASQPVLAQGGDPDVSVKSVMETSIPKEICVGEMGSIKVWITRTLTEKATKWKVPLRLKGSTIIGTVNDPSIASLPQPVQTTGFVSDSPGEAKFEIRGVKAGTTTIDFSAPVTRLAGEVLINNARSKVNYVDITVSVKVIDCEFEFKAQSDFVVPTAAIHATINRLVLKHPPGPGVPTSKPAKRKRTLYRKFLVSLGARRRTPTRPSLRRRRETPHDEVSCGSFSKYSPSGYFQYLCSAIFQI